MKILYIIIDQEGRLEGWELDSCGDCWVGDGCLVDSNEAAFAIDAHMYRYNYMLHFWSII